MLAFLGGGTLSAPPTPPAAAAPLPLAVTPATSLKPPVPVLAPVGVIVLDAVNVFIACSSAMMVATRSTLPYNAEETDGGDRT